MTTAGRSEMDAKEFVITLAFGSQDQAICLLRRNPALVNTLTMVDAIIPQRPFDLSKKESFYMSLQIRKLLGECADQGIISPKKLWQTVNAYSPRHGETMATLLVKLMISGAETIVRSAAAHQRAVQYITYLHQLRKILNSLIQDTSSMKVDVNVPNAHGHYPLQLLQSVKDQKVLRLLSKDYEHIEALTSSAVKKRIQKNRTQKVRVGMLDVTDLPKVKAKIESDKGSNRCSISVLNLQHSTFLKSVEKLPLDIVPIYPKDIYLIATFTNRHIEIMPLRKMYDARFSVNHNGKWIQLPYDSIYPMYQMITKGTGGAHPDGR